MQFVPVLLLSLWAGRTAARLSARTVLLAGNAVRLVSLIGLLGLGVADRLDLAALIVVALVVGCATIFYEISFQTAVPAVLAGDRLVSGNSLVQGTSSLCQLAGPAVVGLLLQQLGVNWVLTVLAVMFGVALALHRPLPRVPPVAGPASVSATVVSVRDGVRFAWSCRPMRTLCLQSAAFNLHEQAFTTAFLIVGVRSYHLSEAVVGLVFGAGSLGVLLGSAVMGRLGRRLHAGRSVTGALSVAGTAYVAGSIAVTLGVPAVAAFGVAFLVNGLAVAVFNVLSVSIRQVLPPPHYLPSALASYRMLSFGAVPLGAVLGGLLVALLGTRASLVVCSASMVACTLPVIGSQLARMREVTAPLPQPAAAS